MVKYYKLMKDRNGGKGFQARGGSFFFILLLFDCEEKSVSEYLCSNTKINFVEGKDNEKVRKNLYCISLNVGSC